MNRITASPRLAGWVVLALAMCIGAALILWLERGATFISDEWAWVHIAGGIAEPSTITDSISDPSWVWMPAAQHTSIADTLHPLNQHLMVVPLLLFKALLALGGTDFTSFKLAEVFGVLACTVLVYEFARRRIGPIAALAPAMVPLFFGSAPAVLLQPLIGVQIVYAIAFGIGALLAIERNDRAGDIVTCVLLCLSLATFSTGVAFVAGVAVMVLLGEERRRRAYVFLIPLVLYGAWRLWANQFGTEGGPELGNVPALPFYFVDSLAAVSASLFGRGAVVGHGPGTSLFLYGFETNAALKTIAFAAVEIVAVAFVAWRAMRRGAKPTLWSILAVLLVLWVAQGLVLTEGRTPGETRYLYAGAVILVLVLAEAGRGVRLGRLGVGIVLAVAAIGVIGNLPRFREGRSGLVFHSTRAHAYSTVIELAGPNADPTFNPARDTPGVAPTRTLDFSTGPHLAFVRRYGSFAYSPARLLRQGADVRNGSDTVMARALKLSLALVPRTAAASCRPGLPTRVLPAGGAVLVAPRDVTVSLRRFGDQFTARIGRLEAGVPALLRVPPDRLSARVPWVARITPRARFKLCDYRP